MHFTHASLRTPQTSWVKTDLNDHPRSYYWFGSVAYLTYWVLTLVAELVPFHGAGSARLHQLPLAAGPRITCNTSDRLGSQAVCLRNCPRDRIGSGSAVSPLHGPPPTLYLTASRI